jgi:hypothetical protein
LIGREEVLVVQSEAGALDNPCPDGAAPGEVDDGEASLGLDAAVAVDGLLVPGQDDMIRACLGYAEYAPRVLAKGPFFFEKGHGEPCAVGLDRFLEGQAGDLGPTIIGLAVPGKHGGPMAAGLQVG